MGDTTSFALDQADEDIFTPTASDEALEAAAGTERGERKNTYFSILTTFVSGCNCC
jgi:hypothetical protein